ncbi:MAG TPA: alpha/beta hydrolase [Stellaceae bacterium]|nr:alpha/beta hydrolase [Stellaceae bacterium]
MTYFLNFRMRSVGGAVVDPYFLEGDGTADPLTLSVVPWELVPSIVGGRDLLFAAHGFNVSYQVGAGSLGSLDRYLSLPPPNLFVGVLWPGDSWLPIVDYPFEGGVALDCGGRLADLCNLWCTSAQSLSFLSHSLGARLVLEAVARLERRARCVCLTAAAINRDCLTTEYVIAAANTERISVLASHADNVLKIAFSIGDPFADLLHDDHSPFQKALGYDGPPTPAPPPVGLPWQIPDGADYGHGDYLPPARTTTVPPPPGTRWPLAADFMKRAFFAQPQTWPPP